MPEKNHLASGMQGLSLRLTAALQASGPLGDSLSKGELREEEIVDALRPHIPQRYDLVKGIVITSEGAESDPQDIILIDTQCMAPVIGRGNTKAVPVEGVVGVMQIKSNATHAEIRKAVHNIASAKRLLPERVRFGRPVSGDWRPGEQMTSATFFGGTIFLSHRAAHNALASTYAEISMKLPPRERSDAICVLDSFSILWANSSASRTPNHVELCFRAEQAETLVDIHSEKDSILYFYLCLAEHLANWITPPIQWLDYVKFGDFKYRFWTNEYLNHKMT